MKHIDDMTTTTRNITMISYIKCEIILHKDIIFNRIIKGGEQWAILSYVMSETRVYYPFNLWSLSYKCLGSSDTQGEVINWPTSRTHNCCISFKPSNLLFEVGVLLPICLLNMTNLPIVPIGLLLSIFPRVRWLFRIQFSFLVKKFLLRNRTINMSSMLVNMFSFSFNKINLFLAPRFPSSSTSIDIYSINHKIHQRNSPYHPPYETSNWCGMMSRKHCMFFSGSSRPIRSTIHPS